MLFFHLPCYYCRKWNGALYCAIIRFQWITLILPNEPRGNNAGLNWNHPPNNVTNIGAKRMLVGVGTIGPFHQKEKNRADNLKLWVNLLLSDIHNTDHSFSLAYVIFSTRICIRGVSVHCKGHNAGDILTVPLLGDSIGMCASNTGRIRGFSINTDSRNNTVR